MDFSCAFFDLKNGEKICRKSWKEGKYIYISKPYKKPNNIKICFHEKNNVKNLIWEINQEDVLAEDWICLDTTR